MSPSSMEIEGVTAPAEKSPSPIAEEEEESDEASNKNGTKKQASNKNGTKKKAATKRKPRKRKKCSDEGCTNNAVRGGVCIRHGAKRKKCSHEGCENGVQSKGACFLHGAKKQKCSIEGCKAFVQSKGVCIRHGAKKKKCIHEGCTNIAQVRGVCIRHGYNAKKRQKISAGVDDNEGNGAVEETLNDPYATPKNDCVEDSNTHSVTRDETSRDETAMALEDTPNNKKGSKGPQLPSIGSPKKTVMLAMRQANEEKTDEVSEDAESAPEVAHEDAESAPEVAHEDAESAPEVAHEDAESAPEVDHSVVSSSRIYIDNAGVKWKLTGSRKRRLCSVEACHKNAAHLFQGYCNSHFRHNVQALNFEQQLELRIQDLRFHGSRNEVILDGKKSKHKPDFWSKKVGRVSELEVDGSHHESILYKDDAPNSKGNFEWVALVGGTTTKKTLIRLYHGVNPIVSDAEEAAIRTVWQKHFVAKNDNKDLIVLLNYPKDGKRVKEYVSIFKRDMVIGYKINDDGSLVEEDYSYLYEKEFLDSTVTNEKPPFGIYAPCCSNPADESCEPFWKADGQRLGPIFAMRIGGSFDSLDPVQELSDVKFGSMYKECKPSIAELRHEIMRRRRILLKIGEKESDSHKMYHPSVGANLGYDLPRYKYIKILESQELAYPKKDDEGHFLETYFSIEDITFIRDKIKEAVLESLPEDSNLESLPEDSNQAYEDNFMEV